MFAPVLHPRTLEACLRDLGDPSAKVRTAAVADLTRHAEQNRAETLAALVRALRDDGDAGVRAAAATGLADVGTLEEEKEAFEALERAADDPSAQVRQMAIAALGELGEARALPRIERALSDEGAEVRFQAVIAYPRLAPDAEAGVAALETATRDEDPFVAHIALRMAEEVGEKAGEVDARLVRRARALLNHDAPMVRVGAAILLGRAGERVADDVLAAVARGELVTREGSDVACAIELCGELEIASAASGLERRAFGGALGFFRDRYQWHARVALARMGNARARREIMRELGSRNADKRTLAVAAAGRARLTDARELLVTMRREGRADQHALDEALALLSEVETPGT